MYKPKFTITPKLANLIADSTAHKEIIARFPVSVPWVTQFKREVSIRRAHHSTAIEGNPLTLDEVKDLAEGKSPKFITVAQRETLNYFVALKYISNRPEIKRNITCKEIQHIHYLLTNKILKDEDCGRWKNRNNYVVDGRGKIIYTPPTSQETPELMDELVEWLNSKESYELHPIFVSGIAHQRIVDIHPFIDGNGRTARVLSNWIFLLRGFDTHNLFALDDYYHADLSLYYGAIKTVQHSSDRDITPFLEYFARGVYDVLTQTRNRLERLKITAKGPKITLTKHQEDILKLFEYQPEITVRDVKSKLKVSKITANRAIRPLVENKFIIQINAGRSTRYSLKKSI